MCHGQKPKQQQQSKDPHHALCLSSRWPAEGAAACLLPQRDFPIHLDSWISGNASSRASPGLFSGVRLLSVWTIAPPSSMQVLKHLGCLLFPFSVSSEQSVICVMNPAWWSMEYQGIKVFSDYEVKSPKTSTWKDAQHHSLSEKCKSKPQWGTITRQSGWLLSKSL